MSTNKTNTLRAQTYSSKGAESTTNKREIRRYSDDIFNFAASRHMFLSFTILRTPQPHGENKRRRPVGSLLERTKYKFKTHVGSTAAVPNTKRPQTSN